MGMDAFTRRNVHRSLLGALLCVLVPTTDTHAQSLSGMLRDSSSSRPLGGVLVTLVDSTGAVAGRALTNPDGTYHLSARAGRYRLRVLRIGFRPHTSPEVELHATAVRWNLLIASQPIRLDTVRVLGRTACARLRPSEAAHDVWEQARAAIAAAELSASAADYRATVVLRTRFLTPDLQEVLRSSAHLSTERAPRLWQTLSTDSIMSLGYVISRPDGSATYYGPDLAFLMSTAFAESHCFRVKREGTGQRIGVAFEPTPERRVPEIRGTVWLDVATARLHELTFAYTNVRPEIEAADAGGEMRFARLGDGGWAIAEWNIRLPLLERRPVVRLEPGGVVRQSSGFEWRLAEVKSGGGELAVVTRGGDTVFTGRRGRLNGSIIEGASRRAVPGARLHSAAFEAPIVSDASGRFAGPELLPGHYDVIVEIPGRPVQRAAIAFIASDVPVTIPVSPPTSASAKVESADTAASQLGPVNVTARHKEGTPRDSNRLRGRTAQVIDSAELRRSENRSLVDLLRARFPNLAVQSAGGAQHLYARSAQGPGALRGNRYCYLQVVIDGGTVSRAEMGSSEPFDWSALLTSQFSAVEYFPDVAGTPAEYRGAGASCGTVLLWSTKQ